MNPTIDARFSREERPTKSGVLVIGESLLDVVRDANGVREHPGGSPLNVACALGRLDVNVSFLTRVGSDRAGEAIRQHISASNVTLVGEQIGDVSTSTAIATVGPDGAADYEFDIVWSLPPVRSLGSAGWVHVGSISTFLPPGADSVQRFLRDAAGTVLVSYDPNIRPRLLGDHSATVARFEQLASLSNLVKLSDEDAAWLYPNAEDTEVIDRILTLGASVVALTRGERGASIATDGFAFDVPSPAVEVVDTIGAGDSFMATLIAQLHVGAFPPGPEQLRAAAARAATAAALTCTRAGADSPTSGELVASLN